MESVKQLLAAIPKDKLLHFDAGFAVAAFCDTPADCVLAAVVAGLGKEVWDYYDYGGPDVWDFVATVAGGVAGALVWCG